MAQKRYIPSKNLDSSRLARLGLRSPFSRTQLRIGKRNFMKTDEKKNIFPAEVTQINQEPSPHSKWLPGEKRLYKDAKILQES